MRKYKVTKLLGEGSFASVYEALNTETNSIVAIKQLKKKYFSWAECIKLREVESLRKLNHLNIVKLKEVVRENNVLYLVFEHMSQNLYQLLQNETKMNEEMIRSLIYQVLQGLKYLHQNGYFHRDMKPENILIQSGVAKLADFGLAKYIRSKPPFTEYVSTRWYRSMEVTLSGGHYNSPIDVWAVGAIMAELYTGRPLFPGKNTMDQVVKICKVRGSPTAENWPEGLKIATQRGFQFPKFEPQSLQELIPNASPEALDLIDQMLQIDPRKRPTAAAALNHRFFKVGIIKPLVFKSNPSGNGLSSAGSSRSGFQSNRSRSEASGSALLVGALSGRSTTTTTTTTSKPHTAADDLFDDDDFKSFRNSLESTGAPGASGEEDSPGRSLYSFQT